MNLNDTIVAISTAPGRGGIGIVRMSGGQSLAILQGLARIADGPKPRTAHLAELMGTDGERIDEVVVTWFQAPKSFTGEDVVEISCHGSPVILRHCVEAAVGLGGRLAEPGEFTLRAYLNGRVDLPQAEAIRDLIDSTTIFQAKVAAQQLGGSLSRLVAPIKFQLIELIALLEAGIDFADDDISIAPNAELVRRLEPICAGVAKLEASFRFGRIVHEGFSLAIAGRPNVGKSSLFNALLEQDRAIVTDIPGTTRDSVSESAAIAGIPVRFIDTAGIRESNDIVESLGIQRSHEAMADADLTLLVFDANCGLTPEDEALIPTTPHLLVANKSDLEGRGVMPKGAICVSSVTGENLGGLRASIVEAVAGGAVQDLSGGFITSLRQKNLLVDCGASLERAKLAISESIPHEMLLLDLYEALRAIDGVSGATTADDILNRIFSTFCIGK